MQFLTLHLHRDDTPVRINFEHVEGYIRHALEHKTKIYSTTNHSCPSWEVTETPDEIDMLLAKYYQQQIIHIKV